MHEVGRSINTSDMNSILGIERRRSRRDWSRKRKSSKDSKKLQRDPGKQRTYSFSPGRNDSIRVPRDANRPPVPRIPSIIKKGGRAGAGEPTISNTGRPLRASTQPPAEKQDWQRVPTLTKRKASKKRKAEHDREEEIKAMISSMPTRATMDVNILGRPSKRASKKKVREGLSSDISLPLAGSIHSSLSGDEHHASFKLSGLGILAPRPTLRCSENPRYVPGASGYGSDRSGSRKRKVSDRISIPVETLKANKRVDDLADDLDAGELRELMERDRKRREKKKITERIKAEKKLARQQEKHRQEEAIAIRNVAPAKPDIAQSEPIPIPVVRKPSPPRQSETDSKPSGSWTSFFKRSTKSKRVPTPSSFSNTSRDSMQNGQGPTIGYTPMRTPSNLPKRTMSKFREDLPELPISPPVSRIQSPEADVVPPIREQPDKRIGQLNDEPKVRYDTPTSGMRSLKREETPTSYRTNDAPSPEPTAVMSQSLGSIDSEGSWLSGRKGGSKRSSYNLPPTRLRESASSLERRYKDYSESTEELGIAEDEYFSRLTPGPEEEYKIHQRQSRTMPSSDDEEGGSLASPSSEQSKWGAVGRHPTVVHREPRAKSREGLLNDYGDYDSDMLETTTKEAKHKSFSFDRDFIEEEAPDSGVRRATSVDLGKGHARRISAGSAKLLNLRRTSDAKV
ncbi:hypothetical protein B0O99DRAFT_511009 [Bisporella sp. PMI_857]|nr:hypothetical protein B0O99DRAFT_511009 [Bisporella sp. PMI_857]